MSTPREKRALLEEALNVELPPGTVVMKDVETSKGIIRFVHSDGSSSEALHPTPSDDPADPLNWTTTWKMAALSGCLCYVFFACYSSLAISSFYPNMVSACTTISTLPLGSLTST